MTEIIIILGVFFLLNQQRFFKQYLTIYKIIQRPAMDFGAIHKSDCYSLGFLRSWKKGPDAPAKIPTKLIRQILQELPESSLLLIYLLRCVRLNFV